ncbi:Ubiquitinyl hydrolase 1 [Ascochyta rabiei]|nr:Ubiquitinyl hydrolase 1 [Ascochyta rabiei]UPX21192.1 Ubiquitinyl hydrolase 1 [Ascochyta rabiei]
MKEAVKEASQENSTPTVRGEVATGASSPSEAYANLSLESTDSSMADSSERTRIASSDPGTPGTPGTTGTTGTPGTTGTTGTPGQRTAHRASSPAKRLHSDMDAAGHMDVDAPSTSQSSPRPTKPLPAAALQRSARATSVEMADAPNNSGTSEADASNTGSSATSVDAAPPRTAVPSLDEQVATVMAMMASDLEERQEGYIISEAWLERVSARTSDGRTRPQEYSKEATQGPIGPIDNSALVDTEALKTRLVDLSGNDFVPLRKGLMLHQNLEVLPARAWDLVVGWYGLKDGSPVIRRHVQNTVPDKSSTNLQWELNPPVLTIRKVRRLAATPTEEAKPAQRIAASRSDHFQNFLHVAKKAAGIDSNSKVRVWRLLTTAPSDESRPMTQPQPSGILTPDASPRGGSPVAGEAAAHLSLIMDTARFAGLTNGTEREQVTGKDEKANEEFNPLLTLDAAGLTQDQVIVLEEADEKGEYISDTVPITTKFKTAAQLREGLKSANTSGRSTPTGGPLTRGRTRNGKVRGHVGLTNLGNTCYMNSALQCLRSVEELSLYFLNNKWKEEVNKVNPIGYKGAIASVYAQLLDGIYSVNASSSFSPKNFKQTLGRAEGRFSGYGQQDSQEFLSWLIDALHEDLNRIINKPYKENPDSDDNTFRDPEAMKQLGEIYRSNHRARNDSVSTDLFNGFYKNTMVCPECDKVSITFDPYSQLTLQLPIEQAWAHTITYVPLYGEIQQLDVDIDKNATIKMLKEYVGKRFGGVKTNRLMASEVYSHKFYRHLEDDATISECNIATRDDIYFYELEHAPSNWPAPKKKAKYKSFMSHSSEEDIPTSASPLHDRIMIPVFHRGPSMSSYRGQAYAMALWPFHIVVTREEAKDYDAILRKVLAKVAQSTTRPILTELNGNSSDQSRPGSDVVLTTEEDTLPDSDAHIKDSSIEGEDMVEVTMMDNESVVAEEAGHVEFSDVLKADSFISPEFRQLFEMKHSRKGAEFVPTGWNTIDHQKPLEPISKRIPVPLERADSEQSSRAGSESSSEDERSPQSTVGADANADSEAAIEQANISSDEEMQSNEPSEPLRGGRQKKKSKKARKHERKLERKHKNNKNWKLKKARVPDQPIYPDNPDDENDGLIRLGEALVLEWNPEAYDALFGGTSADDSRGMDVMKTVQTFDDPEIQEKKAKRSARKKSGITLDECLMETTKTETLSEDNPWYCSNCKEMRRATKTLDIWTVPDILIIHLKRFSGFRSFRDKIDDKVDFPVEGLNLTGKVGFPEDKSLVYDLFAVDNHYGGLGGGHYTATAQNFFDKQWYDYNDSSVSRSSGEGAVTKAAYLLFYRRRTDHPLGPPSLQKIVQKEVDAGSEDDSETENRSRSPAGNGSRLGGSSRNGSSRAGAAGAGVGALHEGGSALLAAVTPRGSGAGVETLEDNSPPSYDDETFYEENNFNGLDTDAGSMMYGPLAPSYLNDEPAWSFDHIGSPNHANDSDDVASDAPNPGSNNGEFLEQRMLEDFGDDEMGTQYGASTPMHTIQPLPRGDDEEVKDIYVEAD